MNAKKADNFQFEMMRFFYISNFLRTYTLLTLFSYRAHTGQFSKHFDFNIRRHHKKILYASRLSVSRRKEHILGYIPKKRRKKEFKMKRVKWL